MGSSASLSSASFGGFCGVSACDYMDLYPFVRAVAACIGQQSPALLVAPLARCQNQWRLTQQRESGKAEPLHIKAVLSCMVLLRLRSSKRESWGVAHFRQPSPIAKLDLVVSALPDF